MGAFVSIRGWLACDEQQAAAIHEIIARGEDFYSNGWETPRRHINWTHYIFYGADIRASAAKKPGRPSGRASRQLSDA